MLNRVVIVAGYKKVKQADIADTPTIVNIFSFHASNSRAETRHQGRFPGICGFAH